MNIEEGIGDTTKVSKYICVCSIRNLVQTEVNLQLHDISKGLGHSEKTDTTGTFVRESLKSQNFRIVNVSAYLFPKPIC